MYRLKEIQEKLKNVVGWEQHFDPGQQINPDLTITESGLYFQGAHPLVTLNNISSIMPDEWNFQYKDWDNSKAYLKGDRVNHSATIWIAKNNNTGSEPDNSSSDWEVFNSLSDFLTKLTRDGISSTIQNFVKEKNLTEETKNLLEHKTFFDGNGRINANINNTGKLVGFEISPVRSMGVTSKIEKIGLQMKGATGTVKVYLFNSSKVDPVKVEELNFSQTNGGFQWFSISEMYLPYMSEDTNAGARWFLVYNQNDLPNGMEAINVSKDWSTEPCGSCNVGDVYSWRELTKYVKVSPFCVKALETFETFPELWDMEDMMYTSTQNYGLNVEITVGCDLTDFIISQKSIFQSAIQQQIAVNTLRLMAMNPDVNVNRNQSNASKMEILYEIDGNTSGTRPGGLGYELKRTYKALSLDTRSIDKYCLSCNNYGVKYRTV